jgi:Tfp pilus assembly protein FimT
MVELLLTLVLLSIAMAIAVPSFRGWADNTNLKDAARTLTGDIAYLREAALASNQNHAITCTVAQNRCAYQYDPGGSGTLTDVVNYPALRNLSDFGSGIQLTSINPSNKTLKVIARGVITPAATLQVTNNRGSVATITIQITGRTYVTYSMQ